MHPGRKAAAITLEFVAAFDKLRASTTVSPCTTAPRAKGYPVIWGRLLPTRMAGDGGGEEGDYPGEPLGPFYLSR